MMSLKAQAAVAASCMEMVKHNNKLFIIEVLINSQESIYICTKNIPVSVESYHRTIQNTMLFLPLYNFTTSLQLVKIIAQDCQRFSNI